MEDDAEEHRGDEQEDGGKYGVGGAGTSGQCLNESQFKTKLIFEFLF